MFGLPQRRPQTSQRYAWGGKGSSGDHPVNHEIGYQQQVLRNFRRMVYSPQTFPGLARRSLGKDTAKTSSGLKPRFGGEQVARHGSPVPMSADARPCTDSPSGPARTRAASPLNTALLSGVDLVE